jgi:hypothetical protein
MGIRQLLCVNTLHPPRMIETLGSVTLFGTPLNGSPLAIAGKLIGGGPISEALEPNNPQFRMLRSWTDSVFPNSQWKLVNVVLGTDDKVVGSKYGDLIKFKGDLDNQRYLNLNDRTLVKPETWNKSIVHDLIAGALK